MLNGRSSTWGSFGHGNIARLSLATTLTDLNSYSPNVSMGGCTLSLPPGECSADDEVQLFFKLPGKTQKPCVKGIVKWRQRDKAGIEFGGCTYSQQVELAAIVLKHRQQNMRESSVA